MLISYAQNFEDVILWRALRHVTAGAYIDLGAQDPVVDSVSFLFYQAGWRGVHVEPVANYAEALRLARPDEEVLEVAILDEPGSVTLHEFAGTGMSTADAGIAARHRADGFEHAARVVPTLTLKDVLDRFGSTDVHWLKIDVEGTEESALRSWQDSSVRPWIVIVEATEPRLEAQTHVRWEHHLLSRGYRFAYWDGLNRFYVSQVHDDLLNAFGAPPNVFDDFSFAGHQAFCRTIQLALENAASSARQCETTRRELSEQLVLARQARDASAASDEARSISLAQAEGERSRLASLVDELREERDAWKGQGERSLSAFADARSQSERLLSELASNSARHDRAHRRVVASLLRRMDRLQGELRSFEANKREDDEACRVRDLEWQSSVETNSRKTAELERLLSAERNSSDALRTQVATLDNERSVLRLQADRVRHLRGLRRLRWLITGRNGTSDLAPGTCSTQLAGGTKAEGPAMDIASTSSLEIELARTLRADGADFVKSAYQALFRRPADVEGLLSHLTLLADGVPKRSVLVQLASSPEGRRTNPASIDAVERLWSASPSRPESLNLRSVLQLDGEDFVRGAFRYVLHRESDETGLPHYRTQLADGCSKLEILEQLANSKEGRSQDAIDDDLLVAISRMRRSRSRWLGWLFTRMSHEERGGSAQRLRKIEQLSVQTRHELADGLDEVGGRLARIAAQVDHLRGQLADPSSATAHPNATVFKDEAFDRLSAVARMKAAIRG